MASVLQPWVQDLPWKIQSVLLAAMRGPDTDNCTRIKGLCRWMRKMSLHDADPYTEYMKVHLGEFDNELKMEVGFVTLHFFVHFLHGLEIIGYKHPDYSVRMTAYHYYEQLAIYLHLNVEPESEMDFRLTITKEPA